MTTPTEPTAPVVPAAAPAPVAPAAPVVPADPADALPDWAKKERTDLRAEAANYRVKLREAQDALKTAKSPEEVAAATSEFQTKIAALEKSVMVNDVARKHGLTPDLADRLRGTTEAELSADAELLKKFVVSTTPVPVTLDGGLTPGNADDGEMDPRVLAKKIRRF